jgi:pyridoxal phosphate enzyme (YggS family)
MKMTPCDNIQMIGDAIRQAEKRFSREPNSVKLLAVSKFHSVSAIQDCLQCGHNSFGESYAQELAEKATYMTSHTPTIDWHYIGPIQSNKTRLIAQSAQWVHSIDRIKIARRLNEQKPNNTAPINICLQLNIDEEANKSGVSIDNLKKLADQVQTLSGLVLRGIMVIPARQTQFDQQRHAFAKARHALEALNAQGYALDTLSMGMSGDMEAAIAEGATIVRIGTAIFGAREPTP